MAVLSNHSELSLNPELIRVLAKQTSQVACAAREVQLARADWSILSRQIFRRPGNFDRSVVRAGRFTSCKHLSLVSLVNCPALSPVLTPPITAYHLHPGPFCWLLCSFSGHFYRWHIVSALTRDAELASLFPFRYTCVCAGVCVCLAWCVIVSNFAFNKNKFLAYSSRWYGYCSCNWMHHPS